VRLENVIAYNGFTMPLETPIRAVLFDYGLVLSAPPDPAAWERMKAILGADEAAMHGAYWRFRRGYDLGALSGQAYWHAVADELGRTLNDATERALIEADVDLWTQPNEAMIAFARSLPGRGLKRGLLSNIGDAMETGVMERCPWLAEFDHRTFSHRLLIAKPDPAIYAHAAQGLGLRPEEIVFLDDRPENIAAARAAGMHAVEYSDHARFVEELGRLGIPAG
jgi:putative hydrolase of the HAD superfamily